MGRCGTDGQHLMQGKRQINCPTCRARTSTDDLAYIDGKAGMVKDEGQENAAGEARLHVKGSYGSKVRLSQITSQCKP